MLGLINQRRAISSLDARASLPACVRAVAMVVLCWHAIALFSCASHTGRVKMCRDSRIVRSLASLSMRLELKQSLDVRVIGRGWSLKRKREARTRAAGKMMGTLSDANQSGTQHRLGKRAVQDAQHLTRQHLIAMRYVGASRPRDPRSTCAGLPPSCATLLDSGYLSCDQGYDEPFIFLPMETE